MVTRLEAPVDEAEPQVGDLRGTKTGLERESQRWAQRCACVVGDGAGSKAGGFGSLGGRTKRCHNRRRGKRKQGDAKRSSAE